MNEIAIQVENLSKQYMIPVAKHRNDTLKDQLTDSLKSIFRRDGRPEKGKEVIWGSQGCFLRSTTG